MITEDYVSFETAKLLKEKGFDCACNVWYSEYTSQFGGEKYTCIEFDDNNKCNRLNKNYKFICFAPTLQTAMKWLRKKHDLAITTFATMNGWRCSVSQVKLSIYGFIVDILNGIDDGHIPRCNTYEEACEEAIRYCLKNLI